MIYLSGTFLYWNTGFGDTIDSKFPVYQSNLNYECKKNFSFLFDATSKNHLTLSKYSEQKYNCGYFYNSLWSSTNTYKNL